MFTLRLPSLERGSPVRARVRASISRRAIHCRPTPAHSADDQLSSVNRSTNVRPTATNVRRQRTECPNRVRPGPGRPAGSHGPIMRHGPLPAMSNLRVPGRRGTRRRLYWLLFGEVGPLTSRGRGRTRGLLLRGPVAWSTWPPIGRAGPASPPPPTPRSRDSSGWWWSSPKHSSTDDPCRNGYSDAFRAGSTTSTTIRATSSSPPPHCSIS